MPWYSQTKFLQHFTFLFQQNQQDSQMNVLISSIFTCLNTEVFKPHTSVKFEIGAQKNHKI